LRTWGYPHEIALKDLSIITLFDLKLLATDTTQTGTYKDTEHFIYRDGILKKILEFPVASRSLHIIPFYRILECSGGYWKILGRGRGSRRSYRLPTSRSIEKFRRFHRVPPIIFQKILEDFTDSHPSHSGRFKTLLPISLQMVSTAYRVYSMFFNSVTETQTLNIIYIDYIYMGKIRRNRALGALIWL
jgi:hypothetical protein